MSGWWWCWWCSCLSLIKCSWYLLCSSVGDLPCTSLVLGTSSLPALHLLGAWPASCYSWSCLSNHVYYLWLLVLVWWCEFTPWCSAHEQGELCECCWLWLLTVMCVICAGGVVVLWCGCAGGVAGRLGFYQFHSQWPFYTVSWALVPWHLPTCTWWLSSLLVGLLARPDWSLLDILTVTHVDKLDCLMIINSVSL
jgi:hypothetical protein